MLPDSNGKKDKVKDKTRIGSYVVFVIEEKKMFWGFATSW